MIPPIWTGHTCGTHFYLVDENTCFKVDLIKVGCIGTIQRRIARHGYMLYGI